MQTMKVMVDTISFNSKPNHTEVPHIVNRLGNMENIKDVTAQELADIIIAGYSVKPAICGKKQDEWKEQQVFFVDVDDNINLHEAMEIAYSNTTIPIFIYTTFSHTEEHHKFRLVFVTENIITNYDEALNIQNALINMFQADPKSKNLNRIFYAGKRIKYEAFESRVSDASLIVPRPLVSKALRVSLLPNKYIYDKLKEKQHNNPTGLFKENFSTKTEENIIKLIIENNSEVLKDLFRAESILFPNKGAYIDYILRLDLAKILGITWRSSFKCLFHDDSKPSAGIFKEPNGVYLYNCFGCGVSYNIIQVFEKLGKFNTRVKANKFIREIFNLKISDTHWQREQKEILFDNIRTIRSVELKRNCPQAYKNIKQNVKYIEEMHFLAMDNVIDDKMQGDDGNVIFFANSNQIAKNFGISPQRTKDISKKNALFVYHNLLKKIDDNEIPEEFLNKAKKIKEERAHKRRVNYFSLPSYNANSFETIEKQGKKWKENGYTMSGCSREMFYRTEGADVANKIYPQDKTYLNRKKELIENSTSRKSDTKTADITRIMLKQIKEQKYSTEAGIINEMITNKSYYSEKEIHRQIKISTKEILLNNNLKRIRTNKQTKKEYNVKGKGYPFIFVNK